MTRGSGPAPTVADPGRSTSLALPFALRGEEGEWLSFGNTAIIIRASAESTGGAFTVFEEVPPLGDVSRHVHQHEDEMYYVLEGEHDFECGDQTFRLAAGAVVFLPRGIPHAHRRVVPHVGRLLGLTVPASTVSSAPSMRQLGRGADGDRGCPSLRGPWHHLAHLSQTTDGWRGLTWSRTS